MTSHAKRLPINHLLENLHTSFGTNIKDISPETLELIENIDINSRIIDAIRVELRAAYARDDSQKLGCTDILDEIFTDFSLAMYLFSVSLIVPARMLVRMALELGIASVYMWDIPHEYWGWVKHEDDLSFSKMIEHLSSDRYATHLANVHGKKACDQTQLKKFYSSLSNTVHGKLNDLPPLSPERYRFDKNNIQTHLKLTIEVQQALINIWSGRFPELGTFIEKKFPQPLRRSKK